MCEQWSRTAERPGVSRQVNTEDHASHNVEKPLLAWSFRKRPGPEKTWSTRRWIDLSALQDTRRAPGRLRSLE